MPKIFTKSPRTAQSPLHSALPYHWGDWADNAHLDVMVVSPTRDYVQRLADGNAVRIHAGGTFSLKPSFADGC